MSSFSPYKVVESSLPDWLPREHLAAACFIAMSLYIAAENNIAIYNLFTKRQGLYFWSLEVGSLAVVLDAIGVIFKFLAPKPRIWSLYTILLTFGWGTFSTAQLFVLYSRLHLIFQNRRAQRYIFIMACASVPLIVFPICLVAWPSWNPNNLPLSARWSPSNAIVERYSQIAFTISETTISTLYIRSLLRLLRSKATVRQRRVMWDLIYVNILCITFDTLTIVLIHLNRTGLHHLVQNFKYMLKFRLEFIVLNQLMAVAARGIRRETMAEQRYHYNGLDDSKLTQIKKPSTQHSKKAITSKQNLGTQSTQLSMPPAALSRGSLSSYNHHKAARTAGQRSGDEKVDGAFDHIAKHAVPGEGGADSPTGSQPRKGLSSDTVERSEGGASSDAVQHCKSGTNSDDAYLLDRGSRFRDLSTRRVRRLRKNSEDEDDEEDEIGLHMWENDGSVILDVPWFKSQVGV